MRTDKWYPADLRVMAATDPAYLGDMTGVSTGSETLTQQHFRDEVDIVTIVRRFGGGGDVPGAVRQGVYGDFTGITNYEEAIGAIEKARRSFSELPPSIRERFGNDPGKLIAFAESFDSPEEFEAALKPPVSEQGGVVPAAPVVT